MGYKIKLFGGQPEKMESEVNKWLDEHNIKLVKIIPCLAINSIPMQAKPIHPLSADIGMMTQVQIQTIQAITITIVYKEIAEEG